MGVSSRDLLRKLAALRRHAGWDRVPARALDRLADLALVRHARRHAAVCRRGEPGPGLLLVGTGELKVSLASEEGREQIVRLVLPGQLVVEGFALAGGCPVSVVARIPTDLWVFPATGVERLCSTSPELCGAIMSSMAFATRRMADALFDVSLHPVEQRLATFILRQVTRANVARDAPLVLERRLDVHTVASLLGTVREEITRAQSRLKRRGVLDLSRNRVTVLDLDALARIAGN